MVKDIMHDKGFLKTKSEEATIEDIGIGHELSGKAHQVQTL